MTIIPRIAAAAAHGFAEALSAAQPRTPGQWVAHCRHAAATAAARLHADPPMQGGDEPTSEETLSRWLSEVSQLDQPTSRLMHGQELEQAARAAAGAAFRASMPLLTSKAATRAYIACCAAGCQDGHLSSMEAKTLLYNAQLALSAYKPAASGNSARSRRKQARVSG